jgi:hypothetical protein
MIGSDCGEIGRVIVVIFSSLGKKVLGDNVAPIDAIYP